MADPNKARVLPCLLFIASVGLVGCAGLLFSLAYAPLAALAWLLRRRERAAPLEISLVEHAPLLAEGEAARRDTLLLVHGFPDSPSMWAGTVDALRSAGYTCLVAALPGARGEAVPAAHSPAALAEALHEALLRRKVGAVTLLTHDWGSAYGYLLAQAHPTSVRRLIALDVGGHFDALQQPALALLAIIEYQAFLALAFVLGRPAGSLILHGMLATWRYPRAAEQPVTTSMCHHYLGFLRAELRALPARLLGGQRPSIDYAPRVPVLFAYGAHKPFSFHSAVWLERVRASPGGQVVEMACGHWITHELPAQWHALLLRWLDETERLVGQPPRALAD